LHIQKAGVYTFIFLKTGYLTQVKELKTGLHLLRLAMLVLLLQFSFALHAQQFGYLIENHLPSEYGGFDQVWHTVQDKKGLLYFGGTSAVFCYDGQNWVTIPVRPGAANRHLYYDEQEDIVYVANVGDFGYLSKMDNGKLIYVSLATTLNEKQKNFTDVWKINKHESKLYFQAGERIFIVANKKVTATIEAEEGKSFALSFSAHGKLYVRQRNVGLMQINGTSLIPVSGGEPFATVRLLGMLEEKTGNTLLLTGDQGFVRMYKNAVPGKTIIDTAHVITDDYLRQSGVLGCISVNDSVIGVNSRAGISFYTSSGKQISVISKASGLSDETIPSLFIDQNRNIWATNNYGISRITFNSATRVFDERAGFGGSLISIACIDSVMYFATTDGLYSSPENQAQTNAPFTLKKVVPLQTEIWEITACGTDILLSSTAGLLLLRNNQVSVISTQYNNCVRFLPGSSTTFLALGKGIITVIERSPEGNYSIRLQYELGSEELVRCGRVKPIGTNTDRVGIWCTTRFKEAMYIELGSTTAYFKSRKYTTANGWETDNFYPVEIGDSTYFLSENNTLRYCPERDKTNTAVCFTKANDIRNLFYSKTANLHLPLDPGLMLYANDGRPGIVFGEEKGKARYLPVRYSGMPDFSIANQALLTPHFIWTVSNTRILNINRRAMEREGQLTFQALVRKIIAGKDSMLREDASEINFTLAQSLDYQYRDITFHFAAPYIDFNRSIFFQCKLEGFDTTWHDNDKLTFKQYTNLPEGTYTFQVRAISMSGLISQPASFTFTILPPWYRTGWAYTLYVLLFVALIWLTALFSARRLRQQKLRLEAIVEKRTEEVRNQKQQLEIQKSELETAYTDIRDSIQYAKRIQRAILPVQEEISKHLPHTFLFYQPQDIVSGDFYWFAESNGELFIACVDCTGHGVPGAFMSMIGHTLLNQLILERGLTEPGQILNELHIGVRHALKQDAGGETQDGMDIALCIINQEKNTLRYAGANRSLWYIRNNTFCEIKAEKRSIAGQLTNNDLPFTTHLLELKTGDKIYLSTDGYADQFGGEKGKKFMVKRFQELLLQIHQLPMADQQKILDKEFNTWKGNLSQVDDVLVIGIGL
jgi:serine phosphatase RsbU (regulator of sigma subunit)